MTTTTAPPSVDVGALAAGLRTEVTERLSTLFVSGFQSLEENARPMDDLQKAQLVEWAFDLFDGLEREFAAMLVRDLTSDGIEVWGLPNSLADLLPEDVKA